MKNKYIFLALIWLVSNSLSSQTTSASPYCNGGYDDGFMPVDHHINKVTIGTLNNNSGATQYSGTHYVYYNNLTAPNLIKGNTYTLSVTHDGGTSIHYVAAYIDFNKDNDFNDAGERVLQKTINDASSIPNPSNVSFIVPTSAVSGTTRMRVMVFEDDDYTWGAGNTNSTPCTADATGFFDWGETEDYNVTIGTNTSIKQFENSEHFIVYPNPFSDYITLKTDLINNEVKTTKIISINGEIVFETKDNVHEINLSSLSAGMYFLYTETEASVYIQKINKL